jgi:hypothetical protein
MRNVYAYIFIVALIAAGCASNKPAGTSQGSKYSEDLSVWRPVVDTRNTDSVAAVQTKTNTKQLTNVAPKYAVNRQLDAVLDSIDRINLTRRSVEGFTIQVFSGDKEGALQAKKELTMALPDLPVEVKFITPTFRVKAGQYYTRIEAQRDYIAVKRHFPSAIVIPDKITIN